MSTIQQETRSVRDMLIAAKVLAKDGKADEYPCKQCKIPVWISFFFDGTGNNRRNDLDTLSQSNVVALFEAHKSDPKNGVVKFYYEGLGTGFNFDKYSELDERKIPRGYVKDFDTTDPKYRKFGYDEQDGLGNTVFGRGFANGIQQRLQKSIFDLVTYLDDVYKNHGITEINLSAFGFSRGATEARIFMNWLQYAPNVTIQGSGTSKKLLYRGKKLNLKFLGIFDTVESIGWAADNKNPEAYRTRIDDCIEHTMHLTASLEMRQSFPLTPTGKQTAKDIKGLNKHDQIVYPGAHSNVGGGYQHLEQGKSLGLSRLTLLTMYNRAYAYGVKFYTLKELTSSRNTIYNRFYRLQDYWQTDFQNFMKHVKKGGTLGQDLANQIALYHQWIRNGGYSRFIIKQLNDFRNKSNKRSALDQSNLELFEDIQKMLNVYLPKGARPKDIQNGVGNKNDLPSEVIHWFEGYVCDSVGGFVGYANDSWARLQDLKAPQYLIQRGIENPT
ncbi:T6SS phospholipase effector Tle1-like catalytic domain-containing protein [Acinetobacter indicus]|uniref:DUF2235 domain-containing protein n=1 Tax=Acinetobacter indicus TaxID=756892 RepID=A0AAW8Z949_9GAMM|nr:DUF2235 domain-containing protein [Acinetobacter indicus]MDV4312562.1 DUF2235 domain-containing protein [Acinetobacter indicus]MDV4316593.1 DUF2235 domain-containing protein [Acinetobacter indicus]